MHLIHDIDQILSIVVYLWLQGFPIRVHTTELISHDHELKYLIRNITHIIQNAIDGVFEREIAIRTIWHPHIRHVFTIIQEQHSYALRCSQWCSLTPLKSIPTNKIYVHQTYLYINNFSKLHECIQLPTISNRFYEYYMSLHHYHLHIRQFSSFSQVKTGLLKSKTDLL
jgi:hypothetical protein